MTELYQPIRNGERSRPLGFGILGCAAIATKRVLPALPAVPDLELVTIGSRSLATAQATTAIYGGRAVAGYERVLRDPDVDVVYVPLPCALHAEWIERALLAGKHVLAEKPLTTNQEETARLVGLAKANGLVLRENFMFLHHSQHTAVRRLLDAGRIGEPRALSSAFAIPPRPPDDIRYRPELGGGALNDVAGYPIRAAQLFLGADLDAVGGSLRRDPARRVDVGGGALLNRPDGVTAYVSFGLEHMYTSSYQILGSEGRISVENVFTPPPGYRPVVCIERQDHEERIFLPPDDQFVNTLTSFVDAVRAGAGTEADDAIVTQARIVDQVRRLAATA